MRITCDGCGRPVSSEVPEGTTIEAFVECATCIEERSDDPEPCGARWKVDSGVTDHCRRLGPHWAHRGNYAEWAP